MKVAVFISVIAMCLAVLAKLAINAYNKDWRKVNKQRIEMDFNPLPPNMRYNFSGYTALHNWMSVLFWAGIISLLIEGAIYLIF